MASMKLVENRDTFTYCGKGWRMRTKAIVWVLIVVVICLHVPNLTAQSSIPPLPADLLFTTSIEAGPGDYPRNIIARVDASTLEVTPFYVDSEAFQVMPISWSPQGDLLVIYRMMEPLDDSYTLIPRQLCILDRTGVLQRCFDDTPPMHWGGFPEDWLHYYPVVWGANGQTLYFMTEYVDEDSSLGYGRNLVQVDVFTGETLRVVYTYPDPWPISPSPSLNYISVGFWEQWQGPGAPAFILNLTTETQLDIPNLVPNNTSLIRTCIPFSPQGSYFTMKTVYDLTQYAPELEPPENFLFDASDVLLLILDMAGNIQHIIGEPEGSPAITWSIECPAWQEDEQAIVFQANNDEHRYIQRYTLQDQQTTTLYEMSFDPGRENYVKSPLVPSPDGTHIALTVTDGPYEDRLVAVLYPDSEISRIPNTYRFSLYPLWVPPLSAQQPIANAGSDQPPTDAPDACADVDVTLDRLFRTDVPPICMTAF
jgi:hypothetical protein